MMFKWKNRCASSDMLKKNNILNLFERQDEFMFVNILFYCIYYSNILYMLQHNILWTYGTSKSLKNIYKYFEQSY